MVFPLAAKSLILGLALLALMCGCSNPFPDDAVPTGIRVPAKVVASPSDLVVLDKPTVCVERYSRSARAHGRWEYATFIEKEYSVVNPRPVTATVMTAISVVAGGQTYAVGQFTVHLAPKARQTSGLSVVGQPAKGLTACEIQVTLLP